jgi:hypothetical protein
MGKNVDDEKRNLSTLEERLEFVKEYNAKRRLITQNPDEERESSLDGYEEGEFVGGMPKDKDLEALRQTNPNMAKAFVKFFRDMEEAHESLSKTNPVSPEQKTVLHQMQDAIKEVQKALLQTIPTKFSSKSAQKQAEEAIKIMEKALKISAENGRDSQDGRGALSRGSKYDTIDLSDPVGITKKKSLFGRVMEPLIAACRGVGLEGKAEYLEAMVFKNDVVLPTIDKLIKDHKNPNIIPKAKIQAAFNGLIAERNVKNDEQTVVSGMQLNTITDISLKGKMSAENSILKAFAEVCRDNGDKKLAETCEWSAMRSVQKMREMAQRLGEGVGVVKSKDHAQKGPQPSKNKNSGPVI